MTRRETVNKNKREGNKKRKHVGGGMGERLKEGWNERSRIICHGTKELPEGELLFLPLLQEGG